MDSAKKLQRRIGMLNDQELVAWFESGIYELGRTTTAYRKSPEKVTLEEMRMALNSMDAILTELDRRLPEN